MHHRAVFQKTDAIDLIPFAAFAELLGRIIKLSTADNVNGAASGPEGLLRQDRDVGAGQYGDNIRFDLLDPAGGLDVNRQGGSGCVHYHHVEILGDIQAVVQGEFLDRGIHHPAAFDHPGREAEPGWIPE